MEVLGGLLGVDSQLDVDLLGSVVDPEFLEALQVVDELVSEEGELPQLAALQVLEEDLELVVRVEAEAAVLGEDHLQGPAFLYEVTQNSQVGDGVLIDVQLGKEASFLLGEFVDD